MLAFSGPDQPRAAAPAGAGRISWRREGDAVDIANGLRERGLEKYAPALDANAINWDVLSELTTDELKEIGFAAAGARSPSSATRMCRAASST